MKFGDRYFFTHGPNAASTTHPFTLDQMNNLLSRNLGDILCDNTAISKVREDVFKLGSLDVECPNTSTLELDLF